MPEHIPVLLDEVVQWLEPEPGKVIVDGTLGAGGHSRAFAERVAPGGRVISLDRDPAAVEAAESIFAGLPIDCICENYSNLPEVLSDFGIDQVDGILLDLGLSSDQLADDERGFSFTADGPLDMRYNPLAGEPAWRMISRMSAEHLGKLIKEYGEERFARRIGRRIVEARSKKPIRTSQELAEIVRRAVPRSRDEHIDPATRTFQALRIAVNKELDALDTALRRLPGRLKEGGRMAVISFHSLEDRRVKQAFRDDPRLDVLTRKPISGTEEEVARNPRARSAKLRVAVRNESLAQPA